MSEWLRHLFRPDIHCGTRQTFIGQSSQETMGLDMPRQPISPISIDELLSPSPRILHTGNGVLHRLNG